MKILVTGASGNVGRHVVKALVAMGEPVKAAGTDKDKLDTLFNGEIETVKLDFTDKDTFDEALKDVDRVFLMRPPHLEKADVISPFIIAMLGDEIKLVTLLSLMGVEKNPFPPHHRIERNLKKSGLPYSFIRPSFFMQNLTGVHLKEIKEDGELFIPAGKSRTSFIDAEDIGLAFATVLHEPRKYAYTLHTLTGSESLTYHEVAEIMSAELGRQVSYPKPGFLKYRRHMLKKRGMDKDFVNVTMMLYFMTRLGAAKIVTDEFQKLTGKKPNTLRTFVRRNKETFGTSPE